MVPKGFHQQYGVDFHETINLVIKLTTIRLVLTLAVSHGWPLRQLDVHNALFQGHLSSLSILAKATPAEDLFVYLSARPHAFGPVPLREEGGVQQPVYYVSHSFRDVETRYPNFEELTYSLVLASRKLSQYFQGRTIIVLTEQLLQHILKNLICQVGSHPG